MASPEQHDIFRAFVLLMADPEQDGDRAELVGRLTVAAREGETQRVARELGARS